MLESARSDLRGVGGAWSAEGVRGLLFLCRGGCTMRRPWWLAVMVAVAGCATSGPKRSAQTTARPSGRVVPRSSGNGAAAHQKTGGEASTPGNALDSSARSPGQGSVSQGSSASGQWYRCPAKNAFMQPIVWDSNHEDQRRYWTETDLTRVKTSKAQPVEVCGVVEQLRWLMTAVCPDGSHPFKGVRQAHHSRLGNVGSGGRCGTTVIDLYRVPCPGKTFMVYIDLYNCPQGRSPFSR